jgi:hypothetical protein
MGKNNTSAPEDDIVSFDQALELCIIGYNEPTFCMYEIENRQLCLCHLDEDGLYIPDKDLHAPTKSQVFRWFREKYGAHMHPTLVIPNVYIVQYGLWASKTFDTYEEAENAAIDKLIEIAKQQGK